MESGIINVCVVIVIITVIVITPIVTAIAAVCAAVCAVACAVAVAVVPSVVVPRVRGNTISRVRIVVAVTTAAVLTRGRRKAVCAGAQLAMPVGRVRHVEFGVRTPARTLTCQHVVHTVAPTAPVPRCAAQRPLAATLHPAPTC